MTTNKEVNMSTTFRVPTPAEMAQDKMLIGASVGDIIRLSLSQEIGHPDLCEHGMTILHTDGSDISVQLEQNFFLTPNLDWYCQTIEPHIISSSRLESVP